MDEQSGNSNNLQESSKTERSSVKMKVDAAAEESGSNKESLKAPFSPLGQGFAASKPVFGASSKLGSSVLASPRLGSTFGSNPFGPKTTTAFGAAPKLNCATSSSFGSLSSPKPVFLRPSQLAVGSNEPSQQTTSSSTFPLKPPSLGNPFARVTTDVEEQSDKGEKSAETRDSKSSENSGSKSINVCTESKADITASENMKTEEAEEGSSSSSRSSCPSQKNPGSVSSPLKFVPLGTPSRHTEESSSGSIQSATTSNTSAAASSSASTSVPGFVFGQNLHERVAEAIAHESDQTSKTSEAAGTSKSMSSLCASATTNGTSEMLFTSVIKKDHINENNHNGSNSNSESSEKPSKSLSEAAREYEEARAVKRKYEEVQIITGEEGESNVLQMNCKLFAYDKASGTWVERGRGTLRLNDKDSGPGGGGVQSRVVIRTTGSLRVVLNTKIWAGMSVDKPSPKSVRLTAMDNTGQIKVFLVMSTPKETEQLHKSLENRVLLAQRASSSQNQTQNEAKLSDNDLASHSLPPEPCSKKRLSEDTSPTPDITSV